MAVHVDDMQLPADVDNNGRAVRGRWSHLFADTSAELEDFARKLGLSPRWIQHQGEPGEHYDVTEGKRQQALQLGARPITYHEAGLMFAGWRQEARYAANEREAAQAGTGPCMLADPCYRKDCSACYPERAERLTEAQRTAALRTLATELDRQAGVRFKAGDYQGALDLLNVARETYPDSAPVLTEHTSRVLAAAAEARAAPLAQTSARPVREGYCPTCGTAELSHGQTACQACRAVEAYRSGPPQAQQYPDLSHGSPGHWCVLPGQEPGRELEAG